jgi:membrane dipeptidase
MTPASRPYLIVDGHEDLAWNMLTFGRDYTRPAALTRRLEAGGRAPLVNEDTLLGYPDWRRGRVGVIFSVMFAAPERRREWDWEPLVYRTTAEARRLYSAQLDAYHRLQDEHPDRFRLVADRAGLDAIVAAWQALPPDPAPAEGEQPAAPPDGPPVGLIPLMEAAEAIGEAAEVEDWYGRGLRIIGPAWAGTRFCGGTREPGPLTSEGYALLEAMAAFNFILDISHMDEKAALQALDVYPGVAIASHANPMRMLRMLPGSESNRHLPDAVLDALAARGGVTGVVPLGGFLQPGWKPSEPRLPLERVIAMIDYICQRAGSARHAALGTDFDGGHGWQSAPAEIDTIADLQKIPPLLAARGYSAEDIESILSANWLNCLRQALPEQI